MSDKLVDITELSESTRRTGAPYYCFGCGGELIANLPVSKSQYFSHKSSGNCSFETYLHSLAKKSFLKHYQDALNSNTPFFLEIKRPAKCNRHLQNLGYVCTTSIIHPFDLTSVYKYVSLEIDHAGFRPDILLTSDKAPPLFIEIAVTHKCSVEKINSGIRILEIQVKSEEDLSAIEQRRLFADEQNISSYNFRRKSFSGDACGGKCNVEAHYFFVFKSGKALISDGNLDKLALKAKHALICKPVVQTTSTNISSTEMFLENVRHYFFDGIPLKNCIVCKHHRIPDEGSLICGFKRSRVKTTNDAADCKSFAPFSSLDECLLAEEANIKQVRDRGDALVKKILGRYY